MTDKLQSIDFSPITIFLHADYVVQSIMVALLLASIVSWSIIIQRTLKVSAERKQASAVEQELAHVSSAIDLAQAGQNAGRTAQRVLMALSDEWAWSQVHATTGYDQVRARILSVADLAIVGELSRVAGRTPFLATIGSISPFVGLFGTVWGIMRSFISIGQTQDTSLAVVAPGIAEALMATAIGLFCAIPAVIGYNRLLAGLNQLDAAWRTITGRVEVTISRQFEARNV